MSFSVHHPTSLGEAAALATSFGERGRFIAGGTDLVIQMNRRRLAPAHLVSLGRIPGLAEIAETERGIEIGALTTHKAIERHPAFQDELCALAEAARVVGGHQVRNIATIGGNIANASPAADVVVALLALDAELAVLDPEGRRELRLDKALLGPGRTALAAGEVIERITLPRLPRRSATAFLKAGRRKAMEISVVCLAARLSLDGEGRCAGARIALGAVAPTAFRPGPAEEALVGRPAGEESFREAGRLAAEACCPIDDVRASARYRRLLVEALVPRALRRCLERLGSAAR